MFELTDTLTYAVPVMLAVLVAKTVADALEPKGIYDLVIDVQQLPYLDAKHTYLWGNVQVGDVLRRDVPAIKLDEKQTVESLRDMLVEASASGDGDGGFPILRRDAEMDGYRMVGYIGANELEHALSESLRQSVRTTRADESFSPRRRQRGLRGPIYAELGASQPGCVLYLFPSGARCRWRNSRVRPL